MHNPYVSLQSNASEQIDNFFSSLHPFPSHLPLQVINVELDKDPRSESCSQMLTKTLCPHFKVLSFTAAICYLQLTMFILEVLYAKINRQGEFLEIKEDDLLKIGAAYGGEKYLNIKSLFLAILLHGNFLHFCLNIAFTLVFCSHFEKILGGARTFLIFYVSQLAGVMLGQCFKGSIMLGS